jgi:hypothetical protein
MEVKNVIRTGGQVANYGCRGFAYLLGSAAACQVIRISLQPEDKNESIVHFLERHYALIVNLMTLPIAAGIYRLGTHILNKANNYADFLENNNP